MLWQPFLTGISSLPLSQPAADTQRGSETSRGLSHPHPIPVSMLCKEGGKHSSPCTPGTVPHLSLLLGVPSSHLSRLRVLLCCWQLQSWMVMSAGWICTRNFLCRIRGYLGGPGGPLCKPSEQTIRGTPSQTPGSWGGGVSLHPRECEHEHSDETWRHQR